MKSNFNRTLQERGKVSRKASGLLLVLLGSAGLGWAVLAGCTNRTPFDTGYPGLTPTPNVTPVYPAPTTVPNKSLVVNFDNNSPLVNPNLMEMNNAPSYNLKAAGSVTAVNNFPAFITGFSGAVQAGGFNSAFCFRVTGTLNDPGTSTFPAAELEAQMEGGNLYDGSFFSGVKFYMLIGTADNALKRDFSIPVYQTQGTPQGGCVGGNAGGCYDNFAVNLSAPAGQWALFNVPFSTLVQAYAGVVTNPPTFTGANLQQMLWLQWEESRNNTAGTSSIDYAVDDIEFY